MISSWYSFKMLGKFIVISRLSRCSNQVSLGYTIITHLALTDLIKISKRTAATTFTVNRHPLISIILLQYCLVRVLFNCAMNACWDYVIRICHCVTLIMTRARCHSQCVAPAPAGCCLRCYYQVCKCQNATSRMSIPLFATVHTVVVCFMLC